MASLHRAALYRPQADEADGHGRRSGSASRRIVPQPLTTCIHAPGPLAHGRVSVPAGAEARGAWATRLSKQRGGSPISSRPALPWGLFAFLDRLPPGERLVGRQAGAAARNARTHGRGSYFGNILVERHKQQRASVRCAGSAGCGPLGRVAGPDRLGGDAGWAVMRRSSGCEGSPASRSKRI